MKCAVFFDVGTEFGIPCLDAMETVPKDVLRYIVSFLDCDIYYRLRLAHRSFHVLTGEEMLEKAEGEREEQCRSIYENAGMEYSLTSGWIYIHEPFSMEHVRDAENIRWVKVTGAKRIHVRLDLGRSTWSAKAFRFKKTYRRHRSWPYVSMRNVFKLIHQTYHAAVEEGVLDLAAIGLAVSTFKFDTMTDTVYPVTDS